ncbi:hypothetical protein T265_10219 [Opisthorchis viverrini]|uniref:Uncharacterized protein n=1 Tax=Opisthorchis viverrini TaxID=6198 RepID=A0A074Z7A1_OPIVI|nr:hypothetical protein T265_10219 [Opisthorchis viverrini]KER21457.1 hypothetical protein T265_10219 [Opisthorchis viverrini]
MSVVANRLFPKPVDRAHITTRGAFVTSAGYLKYSNGIRESFCATTNRNFDFTGLAQKLLNNFFRLKSGNLNDDIYQCATKSCGVDWEYPWNTQMKSVSKNYLVRRGVEYNMDRNKKKAFAAGLFIGKHELNSYRLLDREASCL